MPTYTEPKNYADNATLTEQLLDDGRDYRLTFFNTTKLDSDNIQTGGISTASIADSAVTSAKVAAEAVTTAKINTNAVTTEKLADLTVARGDQEASIGQQTSSLLASGSFSTVGSFNAVTDHSVSITTTGRPVVITFLADSTNAGSWRISGSTTAAAILRIKRDSTQISRVTLGLSDLDGSPTSGYFPPSGYLYIDSPAAGTYTYSLEVNLQGGTFTVTNSKMLVYEV